MTRGLQLTVALHAIFALTHTASLPTLNASTVSRREMQQQKKNPYADADPISIATWRNSGHMSENHDESEVI